jgi:hypothetical protein
MGFRGYWRARNTEELNWYVSANERRVGRGNVGIAIVRIIMTKFFLRAMRYERSEPVSYL